MLPGDQLKPTSQWSLCLTRTGHTATYCTLGTLHKSGIYGYTRLLIPLNFWKIYFCGSKAALPDVYNEYTEQPAEDYSYIHG